MTTANSFTLEEIYAAAHVAKFGVAFESFAKDPDGTLERIGQHDAVRIMESGMRPLLPEQVRLREQAVAQWISEGTWDRGLRERGGARGQVAAVGASRARVVLAA